MERRLAQKQDEVDPELIKNLEFLMEFEAVEEEENWVALKDWKAEEKPEDLIEEVEFQKREVENE